MNTRVLLCMHVGVCACVWVCVCGWYKCVCFVSVLVKVGTSDVPQLYFGITLGSNSNWKRSGDP